MYYTMTEAQKLKTGQIIKLPEKVIKPVKILGLISWKRKVTVEEEYVITKIIYAIRRIGITYMTIELQHVKTLEMREIKIKPIEFIKYRVYETIKNI